MKRSIFLIILFSYLKTILATGLMMILTYLVFFDLNKTKGSEEIFLLIFFESMLIAVVAAIYAFSFFLPAYFIDKQPATVLPPSKLFSRWMPVVAGISLIFGGLLIWIGVSTGNPPGEFWINVIMLFLISYSGLAFYVYELKKG